MSDIPINYTEGKTMGTGWSFDCLAEEGSFKPPRGGLVLKNMRHHGYNFAKEIRLAGIRLDYVTIDKKSDAYFHPGSMLLELNELLFEFSSIKELKGDINHEFKTRNFSHFPFLFGLEVTYTSRQNTFDHIPGLDISAVVITQTVLFSPYQSKPSHEPTGGITAARIHPLITTRFVKNENFTKKTDVFSTVSSIRYDYYIHLTLDKILPSAVNKYYQSPALYGNSAGVFKDYDNIKKENIGNATSNLFSQASANAGGEGFLFSGAEKPIVKEICAKGLLAGTPFTKHNGEFTKTWDNIHWWGTNEDPEYTISAPGAFHAAHMHWRWGQIASLMSYDRQFFNPDVPSAFMSFYSSPLVDPNCAAQSIQFAIVHFDAKKKPGVAKVIDICKEEFSDLFTGKDPVSIPKESGLTEKDKSNLVLWFSTTVSKSHAVQSLRSGLNGTIFIHGIFFAHDKDPFTPLPPFSRIGFPSPTTGERNPLYYPKSKPEIIKNGKWERY